MGVEDKIDRLCDHVRDLKEEVSGMQSTLRANRKWLAIISFAVLGGGGAALNSDKLVALLKSVLAGG